MCPVPACCGGSATEGVPGAWPLQAASMGTTDMGVTALCLPAAAPACWESAALSTAAEPCPAWEALTKGTKVGPQEAASWPAGRGSAAVVTR